MTTWTNETSTGRCTEVYLLIDDDNLFLIDDNYYFIIDKYGICWENEQESN